MPSCLTNRTDNRTRAAISLHPVWANSAIGRRKPADPRFGPRVLPHPRRTAMDYHGRTVVITGGTGGLGTAVVDALLAAGATCHIPYVVEPDPQSFKHRDDPAVKLYAHVNLTDEAAVERFYAQVPNLWA